jgi:CheY-like chemotaxis protein
LSDLPSEDLRDRLKKCTHDLNNVLGQVLGFSSLLVRDIGDANATGRMQPGLLDYAQELLAAGLRGEVIAKQLTQIVRALPDLPRGAHEASAAAAVPDGPARRLLIAGVGDGVADPRATGFVELGWQVESHRSGADALRRFRSSTKPFDAVIAYPSAPEIPGTDLIAAIKALKPKTVCLLVLGDGMADETAAKLAGADGAVAGQTSGPSAAAMVETLLRQKGA